MSGSPSRPCGGNRWNFESAVHGQEYASRSSGFVRGARIGWIAAIMIVTIDGPAGAGKSTIARALAARLGFRFLDSGAMYRAVAWAARDRRLTWEDPARLVELTRQLKLEV